MKGTRLCVLIGLGLPLLLAVSGCELKGDLSLTATADPGVILQGQSSHLSVGVEGGVPPYYCLWDDLGSSTFNLCDRQVTPRVGTIYGVTVHDSGHPPEFVQTKVSVTVLVLSPLSFTLIVNGANTV